MMADKPGNLLRPLAVPSYTLMGPGPANCSPRVLLALTHPVLSPASADLFEIMDDIKDGLRYVFQTGNELTLAVSATGHGGMEAALCNLVEPGDRVLVAVNGIWGERAADMASRNGGIVRTVQVPLGHNFKIEELERAISEYKPNVFFVTQGESSTGVYQPIAGLGEICRRFECLLVVDTVASLCGVEVFTDKWLIDCIYSGTQKVLSVPAGLAPISFNDRALRKILNRKTPVSSFYFDMMKIGQHWGCFPGKPRAYHHTFSSTLMYALREGLAQIVEEGLENCIRRHETACRILHDGLRSLGFEFLVPDEAARLTTVTTVLVKDLDWARILDYCLSRCHVEIARGLGPSSGKVFRIGVMGYNANELTVRFVLKTLKTAMEQCCTKL